MDNNVYKYCFRLPNKLSSNLIIGSSGVKPASQHSPCEYVLCILEISFAWHYYKWGGPRENEPWASQRCCNLCQWFQQAAGLLSLIKANQLLSSSTYKAPILLFYISHVVSPFSQLIPSHSGKQPLFIGLKRRSSNSNWTIVTLNQNHAAFYKPACLMCPHLWFPI